MLRARNPGTWQGHQRRFVFVIFCRFHFRLEPFKVSCIICLALSVVASRTQSLDKFLLFFPFVSKCMSVGTSDCICFHGSARYQVGRIKEQVVASLRGARTDGVPSLIDHQCFAYTRQQHQVRILISRLTLHSTLLWSFVASCFGNSSIFAFACARSTRFPIVRIFREAGDGYGRLARD